MKEQLAGCERDRDRAEQQVKELLWDDSEDEPSFGPTWGDLLVHPHFRVVATPDINGDGKSDLVWMDDSVTGQVYQWTMDGVSIASGQYLGLVSDTKILTAGDFDGQGRDGMLAVNTLGDTHWTVSIGAGGLTAKDYNNHYGRIAGVQDMNGDGILDILIQSSQGLTYGSLWRDGLPPDFYNILYDPLGFGPL
jgi:hypothetical protein